LRLQHDVPLHRERSLLAWLLLLCRLGGSCPCPRRLLCGGRRQLDGDAVRPWHLCELCGRGCMHTMPRRTRVRCGCDHHACPVRRWHVPPCHEQQRALPGVRGGHLFGQHRRDEQRSMHRVRSWQGERSWFDQPGCLLADRLRGANGKRQRCGHLRRRRSTVGGRCYGPRVGARASEAAAHKGCPQSPGAEASQGATAAQSAAGKELCI